MYLLIFSHVLDRHVTVYGDVPYTVFLVPGLVMMSVLQNAFASARVLVAEEASAGIIGFLTLNITTGYVDHLFVHADWRLCGVGRGATIWSAVRQ